MTKLDIQYYTYDELYMKIKNDDSIDYHTLGIELYGGVKLCRILYKEQYVSNTFPFSLHVNKDSYDIGRIKIINRILNEAFERKAKTNQLVTIREQINFYIRFIDWVDSNGYAISTIEKSHYSYKIYTTYLKSKISKEGGITSSSARRLQSTALKLLHLIFEDERSIIDLGIPNIPQNPLIPLPKSSEEDMSYFITFYYNLFHQITDVLLNDLPYPFQLYLPNETLWVWCGNPCVLPQHKRTNISKIFFDYENGHIRSESTVAMLSNSTNAKIRSNLKNAKKMLENNNSQRLEPRLLLGTIALKAFYMLFIAIGGINDSVGSTLPWDDDYEIEESYKGFTNIKPRARNKVVEFELRKLFIQDFYKFLKLRKYILNGHTNNNLFFVGYSGNAHISRRQISGSWSSVINHYMKTRLDPNLPILNSHQLRVNKNHFMIKNYGIHIAAKTSQSLEETVLKHYNGESQESTNQQMTDFFKSFNLAVVATTTETKDISTGQCLKPYTPCSLYPYQLKIEPDCKSAEGCIFCSEYRIHPDETDIRKLFSFKFIINQSKYIADNNKHFENLFSIYLTQIKNILKQVETKYPSLKNTITRVKEDVFENENLSPYWEYKYANLVNLGILL